MADRELLNLLYDGLVTQEDFNYDMLCTVPLYSLFSPYDIQELYKIATSSDLSAKPAMKFQLMDTIMKTRGFVRLAGGTNRLVYRHLEIPRIVAKVGYDSEGLRNNIDEYKNQILIKPFCCKVFEVSNCGTVGLFERVERITSRYEFGTIADDVYDMITNVLVGKYIVSDIGTNSMYNWGIRYDFGPVLLDFPYIYKLDYSKIICKNVLEDGSICNGEIDYDPGFNWLKCTKCGKPYHAKDLSKPTKESGMFVSANKKGKGDIKMEIVYKRGNKVVNVVNTADASKCMNPPKKIVREDTFDPNNIRTVPEVIGVRGKKKVINTSMEKEPVVEKKNPYGVFVGKRTPVTTTIPTVDHNKDLFNMLGIVTETTDEINSRKEAERNINPLPVVSSKGSKEEEVAQVTEKTEVMTASETVLQTDNDPSVMVKSEEKKEDAANIDDKVAVKKEEPKKEEKQNSSTTTKKKSSTKKATTNTKKSSSKSKSNTKSSEKDNNVSIATVEDIVSPSDDIKIKPVCEKGKEDVEMPVVVEETPDPIQDTVVSDNESDVKELTPAQIIRNSVKLKSAKRSVRFDPGFYKDQNNK